jgi:hypothetical protein
MSTSLEIDHTSAIFDWSNRDKTLETLIKVVVFEAAFEVEYISNLHADERFICFLSNSSFCSLLNNGSLLLHPKSELVAGAQDYPSSGGIPCHYSVYLGVFSTPWQKLFISL